jgi:nitronate monooxygenase
MALSTRLTARLGIVHPVILAPMGDVCGGRLAAAVSRAGGLGLLCATGGDFNWFSREFEIAGDARVGCGFVSWRLEENPTPLLRVLEQFRPAAVLLTFGDPTSQARAVRDSRALLMLQVQTIAGAERAIELGADVVVAQGTEAGGHGTDNRPTLSLVPAIVDLVAARAPDTPVVAAGGIADGRQIAAALALGADGVLMGTRFFAAEEALVPREAARKLVDATGEETERASTSDLALGPGWPAPFTTRVLRDDPTASMSQSAGLITSIEPAETLLATAIAEAETTIRRLSRMEHGNKGGRR